MTWHAPLLYASLRPRINDLNTCSCDRRSHPGILLIMYIMTVESSHVNWSTKQLFPQKFLKQSTSLEIKDRIQLSIIFSLPARKKIYRYHATFPDFSPSRCSYCHRTSGLKDGSWWSRGRGEESWNATVWFGKLRFSIEICLVFLYWLMDFYEK